LRWLVIPFAVACLILTLAFASVPSVFCIVDNNYQEHNPWVLFEDNTDFWSAQGIGEGSGVISASISPSAIAKSGASSLQVNVTPGSYLYFEVGHNFQTTQDWSPYERVCFWFYGTNSGKNIQLAIAAPDSLNQLSALFNDSFTGWGHIIIPLSSLISRGNPNLSSIQEVGFFFFNAPFTFYLDRFVLDKSSSTTPLEPTGSAQTTIPNSSGSTSPTTIPSLPMISPTATDLFSSSIPTWLSWTSFLVIAVIVVIALAYFILSRDKDQD
jgi:hypothetical protein